MPVNFLTDEQRSRYGRFNDDPDEGQLGGFFHLDAIARRRAMACRGAGNQLGFAVQLGTARFLGTFLPDPEQSPAVVVEYIAEQLGLDPADIQGYGTRETRWDHQQQIRRDYGYADFDGWEWFALARWLYVRCRIGNERPVVLFDRATARLVEAKILLPGVSTLERLVASVRERAESRLWQNLAAVPDDAEREHLLGLLQVPEGSRVTRLDRLRRAPTTFHAKGLIGAIDRYRELGGYRGEAWESRMRAIPPGRIAELARYAKAARAAAVDDLSADRKIATLVAFAASMPAVAADEALEVFDLLMDDLARAAAAGVVRERARTLRDLDAAALLLAEAWRAVTAAAEDPRGDIRAAMRALEIQAVHAAARTVVALAVAPDDGFAAALAEKYITIIRFLPKLLDGFDFTANPAGQPVLDAAPFVKALRKRRNPISPDALPAGVLTEAWRRRVIGLDGVVDKRAFTVAFTEALREKLRRHDITSPGCAGSATPTPGC
jgi:Domain of unknown function (DUF4158)